MPILNLDNYKIFINEAWDDFQKLLSEINPASIIILVDENTKSSCLPILHDQLKNRPYKIIEIHSGEINKTLGTVQYIWDQFFAFETGRKGLLINLGGGVIGDMGGFAASTYKRGIRFLQMPTTLLAQVDASVGGKLGIDYHQVKNSIGVFNDPQAVWIQSEFLKTLPSRQILSGFAEIIKHALIADAEHWQRLQAISTLQEVNWDEYLPTSLGIKQKVVASDPFEHGLRKILNFGHTIGHAVESVFLEKSNFLFHGEAIAVGMIAESWLATQVCTLKSTALEEIIQFIKRFYTLPALPEEEFDQYISLMQQDKKNESAAISFSLLDHIGQANFNIEVDSALIRQSLQFYNAII